MRKVFFCLLILSLLLSCAPEQERNSFTLITWNTYLFFDNRDDGDEYAPFRKQDGYTEAIYEERIRRTALMMAREFSSADVILLQEIESNTVLLDLLQAGLRKKGFSYYGVVSDKDSTLNVGYISKIRPEKISVHGTGTSREQLELSFFLRGEEIRILTLHAKSRIGGGEDTRYDEFSVAREVMDSHPESLFVIAGDFNADPREREDGMSNVDLISSFDTPLILTGDRGEMRPDVFFTPALDYGESVGDGTYFYLDRWFWFDNFIFGKTAFDSKGWEYGYSRILYPSEFVDIAGFPLSFDPSTSNGMSDHLPLMSVLVYN